LDRRVLRDDQWERIAPLVPGKVEDAGRSGADNRRFVEAVLWIVRVGAPWRDLPKDFGKWNSVFQRFRRWVRSGVFDQMFEALSADADFEYVIVDGTIVRVHQHGSGARGGTKTQAIGRSRGGLTIVALVDALGNLVRFVLLPGQRHDSVGVAPLLEDLDFAALLADKAFDGDALRADLNDRQDHYCECQQALGPVLQQFGLGRLPDLEVLAWEAGFRRSAPGLLFGAGRL